MMLTTMQSDCVQAECMTVYGLSVQRIFNMVFYNFDILLKNATEIGLVRKWRVQNSDHAWSTSPLANRTQYWPHSRLHKSVQAFMVFNVKVVLFRGFFLCIAFILKIKNFSFIWGIFSKTAVLLLTKRKNRFCLKLAFFQNSKSDWLTAAF